MSIFDIMEIVSWGTATTVGVGLGVYKSYKAYTKNSKDVVVDNVNKLQEQRDLLVRLQTKTDADSVALCLLHNGEFYDPKNSILKMTRVQEIVNTGVAFSKTPWTSVLVSRYLGGILKILEKDIVRFSQEDLPSGPFKGAMIMGATEQCITVLLKKQGKVRGFIILNYNTKKSLDKCIFNRKHIVKNNLTSDKDILVPKTCTQSCKDCPLIKYAIQLETILDSKKNSLKGEFFEIT